MLFHAPLRTYLRVLCVYTAYCRCIFRAIVSNTHLLFRSRSSIYILATRVPKPPRDIIKGNIHGEWNISWNMSEMKNWHMFKMKRIVMITTKKVKVSYWLFVASLLICDADFLFCISHFFHISAFVPDSSTHPPSETSAIYHIMKPSDDWTKGLEEMGEEEWINRGPFSIKNRNKILAKETGAGAEEVWSRTQIRSDICWQVVVDFFVVMSPREDKKIMMASWAFLIRTELHVHFEQANR